MNPKIKVLFIAGCGLILLSASFFIYSLAKSGGETGKEVKKMQEAVPSGSEGKTKSWVSGRSAEPETKSKSWVSKSGSAKKIKGNASSETDEPFSANSVSELSNTKPLGGNTTTDEDDDFATEDEAAGVDGILIYEAGSSIFSLDLSTRVTTKITALDQNLQARYSHPKVSPDGSLIATWLQPAPRQKSGIYVMARDGSDLQLITQDNCRNDDGGSFDFGPDGKTIVYVDANKREIWQISISNNQAGRPKLFQSKPYGSFSNILRNNNYLYFIHDGGSSGLEIQRKNMQESFARRIYRVDSGFSCVKYSVSPDGKDLLVAQKRDQTSQEAYQIFISNNRFQSRVGPLHFEADAKLDNFFWSPDGAWIYAERIGNNPGLVRFKFDQVHGGGPIKLQLVDKNVRIGSGASFVPE